MKVIACNFKIAYNQFVKILNYSLKIFWESHLYFDK